MGALMMYSVCQSNVLIDCFFWIAAASDETKLCIPIECCLCTSTAAERRLYLLWEQKNKSGTQEFEQIIRNAGTGDGNDSIRRRVNPQVP